MENAKEFWNLAQARYQNGCSLIVDLNQAELNLISSEISLATTRYEYLIQRPRLIPDAPRTNAVGVLE